MRRTTFLIVVMLAACDSTRAANISFMPGDAFFSATLTAEVAESASPDRPFELRYDYAPKSYNFGDFAGFQKLRINGLSAHMASAIRDAYVELRKHIPKKLVVSIRDDGEEEVSETNGFYLFVYRRDVDWRH